MKIKDRKRLAFPETGMSSDIPLSSPERVIDAITRGILTGRYVPGQKLIEADLTQALGVSRGPVREALKRLDAEGVVTLTPHRGAYIRLLTRREVLDLEIVLESLTALIARLAAEAVADDTSGERKRLMQEWLNFLTSSRTSTPELFERRRQFYDLLIEVGKNTQLESVMPTKRVHLIRLQTQQFFGPDDIEKRLAEYVAIANAVIVGNPQAAERAMRRHMKRNIETTMAMPDGAFAPD
ncbi:GntR family transcriptional regulator [Croceicoccus ponticola]|uniref:GntR family transcriptional regulator n=1 Tax=Croceicoccus ponticola TaxID=2217664 RepID=UPI0013E34159|nr:GntR family transcriptional regulator [Croceicoccus ponticola]